MYAYCTQERLRSRVRYADALQTSIKVMCKFSKLIHSKRFWTLVASIVAALTAFFVMEGCSTQRKVVVTGACVDSLYYETSTVIKK